MSLETSRHGVQLELSRARLVQFAEHLVFPDRPRRRHANGRFVFARLAAIRRMAGGHAIRHHILVDGRDPRDARLHSGARTNSARVAHLADALNLSADAQLLHLESDLARGERRLGELGQTRAHRECAGPRVIVDLRVNEAFETLEQRRAACAAEDTVSYSNRSDDSALCVSQKRADTSIYRSKRSG